LLAEIRRAAAVIVASGRQDPAGHEPADGEGEGSDNRQRG